MHQLSYMSKIAAKESKVILQNCNFLILITPKEDIWHLSTLLHFAKIQDAYRLHHNQTDFKYKVEFSETTFLIYRYCAISFRSRMHTLAV
jgi:hypothetical protein